MTKNELLDILAPFPDTAEIKLDVDVENIESAEISDANLEDGVIKISVVCTVQS